MSAPRPPPDFSSIIPDGDDRIRDVCNSCGFVNYVNPKIVVGSVVWQDDKLLICRRAIEPRRGWWTLPAGYMENGETAEEAAMREAREEACADIEILGLLAVYSVPRISQVQLMYRAHLRGPAIAAGPESLEVALVRWDEIPWGELAFPTVRWALQHFDAWRTTGAAIPFTNPPGETHR
jgi:ADP-ribose pyrophosphatase YjhB (NUDIX family)